MTFNNIQALRDISQCSHNSRILILFFKICDKEINNLLGSVLLFKQFAIQIRLNFLYLDNLQLVNFSSALNLRVIKYFTQWG